MSQGLARLSQESSAEAGPDIETFLKRFSWIDMTA